MNHLKIFFTRRESIAIGVPFFIMGFLFGNWATMIPYVKYHFGLSDSTLGLILLSVPFGCLIFNPFSGWLVGRYGMRQMTVVGMILLSLCYYIPMSMDWLPIVPIGLVLAGVSVTILNIAMNMTASEIEKTHKIYIMSTCHGMFSLGLMVGSLMRTFTLSSWTEPQHMALMCGLGLLSTAIVARMILHIRLDASPTLKDETQKIPWAWPSGALLIFVIISLCTNVTEGSMADWATLYMRDIAHAAPLYIGWGLSAYSALMALGRFMGDAVIPKYGANAILSYGAILTFSGLGLAILLPYTMTTILGFGMVGLGVSLGSPILYAAAARIPDIPNSGGLAVMNTFSMGGFLIGPVAIGFISDLSNLAVAFGFVMALATIWYYKSRSAVFY
jgi:MFS family permease